MRRVRPLNQAQKTVQEQRPAQCLLALTLPLPPSINHQYATVQGRRVLSSAGRKFKLHVGQEMLCHLARRSSRYALTQALDGLPLALDLRFYFVSALRRDIDGGLKITQDAVCEALGINDNRIIEVMLRKEIDAATPRMELSLRIAHVLPPLSVEGVAPNRGSPPRGASAGRRSSTEYQAEVFHTLKREPNAGEHGGDGRRQDPRRV